MPSTELAVGDRARRSAGSSIVVSLGLVAVFGAMTWLAKEISALNLRQPWQDDPYDVLVSLDFVVLPVLVVVGVLRAQLCRRFEPLPVRRLADLLRVCGVAVGVSLVTELAQWVAVAGKDHRPAWNAVTAWQVAALSLSTMAMIAAAGMVWRAARTVRRIAIVSAQPDWLADAITLGLRGAFMLGRHEDRARTAVRWADACVVTRVRARPVAAAAVLAAVLALPYAAGKLVLEGYPLPLVLLSFAFPAASLFVLVVVVGAYLRVVTPRHATPPAWLSAALVACTVGAVAFSFHDSLLSHQTVDGLTALFFGAGAVAGAVSLTAHEAFRRLGVGNLWVGRHR